MSVGTLYFGMITDYGLCYTIPMKRLGILGGTFNPIHNGHLAMAERALQEFKLDEIVFIPTNIPPHKDLAELINKEDRFNMVKLAIEGKKDLSISRIELDREGTSYATDTFKELSKKGDKLYYIIGMDSLNEMMEWKDPLDLFNYCEFIVAERPGEKTNSSLLNSHKNKIHVMGLNENISATDIRQKVALGDIIKKLVPRAVADYIYENNIYK